MAEHSISKVKFFSVGIVAENKALNTDVVEVSPVEELPLLDGEITDNATTTEVKGVDKDNTTYNTKVNTTNTVSAKWLRLNYSNRISAPDVRRGAAVMLYQFGDEKKYYWTTLMDDSKLRKLETVIYAFSGTQSESADVSGDNNYYLEISTHKKLVTFHTSKANGEPFAYDIQLNTGEGKLLIQDDNGNFAFIDSKAKQIRLENTDGCFFEFLAKDCTLNIPGNWEITVNGNVTRKVGGNVSEDTSGSHDNNVSGKFDLESSGTTLTAPQNTLDAPSNTIAGNMSVKSGNGAPGDGEIEGNFTFKDSITIEKDATVEGTLTANKLVSHEAIEAPNV